VALRDDILNAVYEANRFHRDYDTEARAKSGEGRIDVFGMLVGKDIPVMFRPLRNLLGAYIDHPDQGVMVTTQRQLPVQRFTAAHELGHAALGHEASLDEEEVLTRALFDRGACFDSREIQANAFATALLAPQWLIVQHMQRQGWNRASLADPIVVYQLSLRMGTSYPATCYALLDCKGIDQPTCDQLLEANKKKRAMKQTLAKPYTPVNWHGDVWLVTERDIPNCGSARRFPMPATTRKTFRRPTPGADRPRRSRQGSRRLSSEETAERRERVLREQVTYLLWVMAQTVDKMGRDA
jgi:Zn-dependent peptidase ImmA (M78 family)